MFSMVLHFFRLCRIFCVLFHNRKSCYVCLGCLDLHTADRLPIRTVFFSTAFSLSSEDVESDPACTVQADCAADKKACICGSVSPLHVAA